MKWVIEFSYTMEVADLNDLLNVRNIKMETGENAFVDPECAENSDPMALIPQYVTESDLGKASFLIDKS